MVQRLLYCLARLVGSRLGQPCNAASIGLCYGQALHVWLVLGCLPIPMKFCWGWGAANIVSGILLAVIVNWMIGRC